MADEIYEQLAEALARLPNGFTRTASRAEIPMLRKIYPADEAAICTQLGREMEPVDLIAARIGLAEGEARKKLMAMVRRGLVWFDREGGKARFRLAPFVVGSYEAQLDNMDHELSHLFEDYLMAGGAEDIMRPQPALNRVVPARGALKTEAILPYQDVREILEAGKSFRVHDCICRKQQHHMGHDCKFPQHVCLTISQQEGGGPDNVSREDALALLDRVEEIGLVHTVSNMRNGLSFVCNCCGCCCGIMRGINEKGIAHSVAYASYLAHIDPDACTGCGICIERCQVHAIAEANGVAVVDATRCIGCGLCVTGCPSDAAHLHRKPEAEIALPPVDYHDWEEARLKNRAAQV
jgi:ferredoxin